MSIDDDQEFRDLISSARSVPMAEVLTMLDLELPNSTGHIASIFNEEKTPSLHVGSGSRDDNLWYDFSTGKGGDTINFVREYFGCSFMRAVKFLVRHADPDLERRSERKVAAPERIPDLTAHFATVTAKATVLQVETVKDWMSVKWPVGNADWAFDKFNLGVVEGRDEVLELWAPHFNHDKVCGVKIRTIDGRKLAVPGSKFVELYGDVNAPNATHAWLVEGESDTWSLKRYVTGSGQVFGLPSGAGMMKPEWVRLLSAFDRVWLALDSQKADGSPDEAGLSATSKWIEALPNAAVVDVPDGRVAEALMEGWRP